MAAVNIDPLIATVRANSDAIDSATLWINGSLDRQDAAVAAALALGATAAELAPLTDELALQRAKAEAVVAAIVAHTPAAA